MIGFEQKNIRNNSYYYLSERILVDGKYKKIQVFVGKNVPKETGGFYTVLADKEKQILPKQNPFKKSHLMTPHYLRVELSRIDWKYYMANLSPAQKQKLIAVFGISFIYQSNAIEGSRLSQAEVEAIIKKSQ